MDGSLKTKMFVAFGLGVSALSGVTYWLYKSMQKQVPPAKWRKIGTLEEIWYFPIKSCAGIKLDSAKCDILGIRVGNVKDRCLMLVDRDGKMVSARTHPKMMKIQPEVLQSGKLLITAPGMNPLEFDYEKMGVEGARDVKANLWNMDVYVMECGAVYDQWFSKFILGKDEGYRLVYYPYPVPTHPIVSKIFRNSIFLNEDTGSLQDVSSYHLINDQSVKELNTRLKNKVHHLQFRGNFLIKTTGPAFDEDNWNWIRIGNEAIFRSVAPCYRCILPNINPFTAERDPDFEPLKTLKSYRAWGQSKDPRMGLQLGLRSPGDIKKGDPVYVEDTSADVSSALASN